MKTFDYKLLSISLGLLVLLTFIQLMFTSIDGSDATVSLAIGIPCTWLRLHLAFVPDHQTRIGTSVDLFGLGLNLLLYYGAAFFFTNRSARRRAEKQRLNSNTPP